MGTFKKVKLGDVVEVKGGKRLPLGHELTKKRTVHPYIRARDVGGGKITFDDPVYVNENTFPLIKNYIVNKDDVCITIVGANVGDIGFVPTHLDGANLTENAVKLFPKNVGFDHRFLKYCLLTDEIKLQMKQLAGGGSAQPKLGLYKINALEIPCPTIENQCLIASILSAYDDLIENNEKRIRALEEMAQRLYTEWFVKFKYPGHEKVKMVDSGTEYSLIPDKWEVKKLGDVIELAYGKALKEDSRKPGAILVCGSGGIVGTHNEKLVEGPGIVVGRKGNAGTVFWVDEDFYPIDTAFFVRSKLNLIFAFYLLKHQNFVLGDAAVPGLNREQAYRNQMLVPPNDLVEKYVKKVEPIRTVIGKIIGLNGNLSKTRDLLIPCLVTGKRELK